MIVSQKRPYHNIWRSQIHNSKLITSRSLTAKRVISYDCLRQVMIGFAKFEIALKECNESEYWLELLYETNSFTEAEFKDFQSKCIELRRMLVSSVTTLKKQ